MAKYNTSGLSFLLILAALCSTIWIGCAPESSSQLEGVWKVTKIVDLVEKTETDPGNMHYVITPGFIMTVGGKEDRPVVDNNFALMTPEEILSQLPAGGGFMEYEIIDGKIHRTTRFALSEYFEGKLIVTEFEVDAETLIFRDDHHADGHLREWHMIRLE
ncbi:MAG: hypothetical protein O7C75_11730 [Verrucomicrobia bacterium]|nr:hypothetical protein [Verrucomicrobiota bacterium]